MVYSILGLENLSWEVATYTVFPLDNHKVDHKDRGNIKNVMWDLRAQHRALCPGYGFVIDVDEVTVAIPQRWDIPRQNDFKGYRIGAPRSM